MATEFHWPTRIFAACSLLLFFGPASVSQDQSKVIHWSDHPQGNNSGESAKPPLQLLKQVDGVEIEEVRVEGKPITLTKPFSASADWLRNIGFRVRNVSSEPLTFLQITLTLPNVNKPPEIPYVICRSTNQVCLRPGEEVELVMPGGGLYDWVKKTVADQGRDISTINEATIKYVLVKLATGTEWSSGCIKISDPDHECPHSSP